MKHSIITRVAIVVLLVVSNTAPAFAEELRLLLITNSNYKLLPLNNTELRRLFLGKPVFRRGERLVPLINKSDDLCYQVFLQSILGMSEKRYERALVADFYRKGLRSPTLYTNKKNLLLDLTEQHQGISFLFDPGEGDEKKYNVVQEIWISDAP